MTLLTGSIYYKHLIYKAEMTSDLVIIYAKSTSVQAQNSTPLKKIISKTRNNL